MDNGDEDIEAEKRCAFETLQETHVRHLDNRQVLTVVEYIQNQRHRRLHLHRLRQNQARS